jgi:3-methyladenine DNA glycosylase AlkD
MESPVAQLENRLASAASDKTKRWWEQYLRNVITFFGVGIPKIREILSELYDSNNLRAYTPEEQIAVACRFISHPSAEIKLAGILCYQLYLLDSAEPSILIDSIEKLFGQRHVFDWNTCDWLCVRVLTPLIDRFGEAVATRVFRWKDEAYLWQARASVVAFAQAKNLARYLPYILSAASVLIRRDERFAKTAAGWALREIWKIDPSVTTGFLKGHAVFLTTEVANNALKYTGTDKKKRIKETIKGQRSVEREA